MPGSTTNDGVLSGAPERPAGWELKIGQRYLKGNTKDLVPVGREIQGLASSDLDAAQDFAWCLILSRLVVLYDVSDWYLNPPNPLYQIWDLLASSYVMEMVEQRVNTENELGRSTAKEWFNRASMMLGQITDPKTEGERMYLTHPTTYQMIPRRTSSGMPVVINVRGVEFFPTCDVAMNSWGHYLGQSIEEFVRSNGLPRY